MRRRQLLGERLSEAAVYCLMTWEGGREGEGLAHAKLTSQPPAIDFSLPLPPPPLASPLLPLFLHSPHRQVFLLSFPHPLFQLIFFCETTLQVLCSCPQKGYFPLFNHSQWITDLLYRRHLSSPDVLLNPSILPPFHPTFPLFPS